MHFRDEYSREERFRAQLEDPAYKDQAETIRQLLRYGIESSRKEIEAELKDVLTYEPGKPPLALRIERLHRKVKEVNQRAHTTFMAGRLSRIRESARFGLARARGEPIRVYELREGRKLTGGAHHSESELYCVESVFLTPSFRDYLYWLVETVLNNGEISELRVCPECYRIFKKTKRQRFCGTKCKNAFNNRLMRPKMPSKYKEAKTEKLRRAKQRLQASIRDRKQTMAKSPEAIDKMIDEIAKKILHGKDPPTGGKKLFKRYVEAVKKEEIANLP